MTGALPKLCLAASGGGHVRQLLDLEPLWRDYPRFFVTEDTALGRSIAERETTYFVPHFAIGQARLGAPFRMLGQAVRSVIASARIIRRERPDVVVTTGAGSQLFIVLWARLSGARVVLVDSFARFRGPSAFARLAGPLANHRIAQSKEAARKWKGAVAFDPFRRLEGARPAKEPLVFATVGATLPFNRLVEAVAEARRVGAMPERVIVQTGEGGVRPEELDAVESLPFEEVRAILRRADIVICHGGTGSLITALREGCRVIAIPRRFDLGEHYDDHQREITAAFAERGLIQVVDGETTLAMALERARATTPVSATTDPSALIDYLRGWIGTR